MNIWDRELTIKNVNKSFEVNGEKINVLNDINLDIKEENLWFL